MILRFSVHIRRERMETMGYDEKCRNREKLDTTETVQVGNTSTNRRRAQLFTLPVREGGPETERERIRAGHYLLFGFR